MTGEHASGITCVSHKIYELTCDDYEILWNRCGGHCEACDRELDLTPRSHVIDHDHRYGNTAVRGIICTRCNGHLGRLENPRVRPTFGSGPGRWFASYLRRAWFVRGPRAEERSGPAVDHDRFNAELREWTTYNKQLFEKDSKAAVVPTDKPSEIVKILRREMSHQAFGVLVRLAAREAETPKGHREAA